MIFTRISRSLFRSSPSTLQRSRNHIVRGLISSESSANACIARVDGGTGLVRIYMTSIGANGQITIPKTCFLDVDFFAKNLGLRRLFCSEAPKKKNYENYYPKDKKDVPKGGHKQGSKGDSGKNDNGENFMKQYQSLITPLMFITFVLSSIF